MHLAVWLVCMRRWRRPSLQMSCTSCLGVLLCYLLIVSCHIEFKTSHSNNCWSQLRCRRHSRSCHFHVAALSRAAGSTKCDAWARTAPRGGVAHSDLMQGAWCSGSSARTCTFSFLIALAMPSAWWSQAEGSLWGWLHSHWWFECLILSIPKWL